MSKSRQPAFPEPALLVRAWVHKMFDGARLEFFDRTWVQLIYAVEGVMTVTTPEGLYVIPPTRAVWVPPGKPREARMSGTVSLRCLYFRPRAGLPKRCQAVSVTPLARELIRHVADNAPLLAARPRDRRLVQVLFDQLVDLPLLPLFLPPPRSAEALCASEALVDGETGLDEASRRAAVSRRTLERRFREETGFSLGAWAHQARLIESLRRLAAGSSVTEAALSAGYSSSSAYIAAFRRTFEVTPGAMYRDGEGDGP